MNDGHMPGAPVHLVKDWKKPRLACKPDEAPPPRYMASQDPDVITCSACIELLKREFKHKCACGRDDCTGDCPQADMAYDMSREEQFFR